MNKFLLALIFCGFPYLAISHTGSIAEGALDMLLALFLMVINVLYFLVLIYRKYRRNLKPNIKKLYFLIVLSLAFAVYFVAGVGFPNKSDLGGIVFIVLMFLIPITLWGYVFLERKVDSVATMLDGGHGQDNIESLKKIGSRVSL